MLPIETIKEELQSKLSQKRYRHSLGVADEAVRLALHYGADKDKAYLAGLIHDCAKEVPPDNAIAMLKETYGITPDCVAVKSPNVLHGSLGACMAQSMFQICDPEILDAVRYHTTGKANMSLLAKIIYIADYIEPGRSYPDVDKLRKLTYEDINRAILFGIDFTIETLVKKGMVIHPDTIHCRNDIVMTLDRKTEERVKEDET